MSHPLEALDKLVVVQGELADSMGNDVAEAVRKTVMTIVDSLDDSYKYLFINYNPTYFSMLPENINKAKSMVAYAKINDPHNTLDYAQLVRKYEKYVFQKRQSKVSH